MPEHLSGERLSALLDDDAPTEEERSHLDACPACEGELRRLRRMRMALSALDDLEAPAGGWASIEAALPDRERAPAGASAVRDDGRSSWSFTGAWARAAAAVVLFAGGLALGTHLSGPGGGPDAPARAGTADGERVAVGEASGGDAASAEDEPARPAGEASERADVRAGGGIPLGAYRDPADAAERLARLDAMMQAAREAIREDPSDPAMNDLLFRVAEDRQALVEALHLATLEYR